MTHLLATYDVRKIHEIVNSAPVLHVSFTPDPEDPFPGILPMIGQMGSFEYQSAGLDEPLDCYLHGYVTSRIMNLARSGEQSLAVSIAATKVDGLILSLTPNSHSYNYRSAVLHGYATPVTDVEEKLWAMKLITNSVVPDRYENTRNPPDNGEMQSTQILRIRVVSGSGKIRDGAPHDDKKDLNREDVTEKVWTGVVPVWEQLGQPIPNETNKVTDVPAYLDRYISNANATNEAYARKHAVE